MMKPEIKTRINQIQAGEIPQGYKKTKLGIIPQEWEVMPLKSRFDRLTRKNSENNTNVMTISAQYGLINQEEFFKKEIASEDKSNYYLLHNGEFAYNKSYSSGYPFGAIKRLSLYDKGIVSPLYICFSANNHNPCPEFYQHYFEGGKLNSEIQAIAQEGARNHGLLNISVEDFFYTKIIVPPLEEQKKIADILSAQGRIIELCERKTEQLKRMKKYYIQKMFPKDGEEYPEIRFKGFTEPWEQRKLGEVLEISTHKNGDRYTKEDVLSVSDEFGCVNQIRFQGRSFAGADISNYKIVSTGDIVYTRSPLQAKPFGIIKIVRDEIGVVSPLYIVNKAINGNDAEFIYRVFDLPYKTNNYLSPLVRKGAKNTMNISEDEWLSGDIIVSPIYEEQQTIGAFFKDLDHLITLHQRKCEEEKKKKKALQQLLLTGIVRV